MINNKTIRDGIVTRLTGETAAGTEVYSARILPHKVDTLPAINVYTPSVLAQTVGKVTPAFNRTIDIAIDVVVADSTLWQDIVDDILLDIKTTLFTDETWASQFAIISGYTEEHNLDDQGEKPVAMGTLTITVEIVEFETFV